MKITDLRRRIDVVDRRIVALLNKRVRLAARIGRIKARGGAEPYVPAREREVLERAAGRNRGPIGSSALQAIFREIMSASLAAERDLRIAYHGVTGSSAHQAALAKFGSSVRYVACISAAAALRTVERGKADYGVIRVADADRSPGAAWLDGAMKTRLTICAEFSAAARAVYAVFGRRSDKPTGRDRTRIVFAVARGCAAIPAMMSAIGDRVASSAALGPWRGRPERGSTWFTAALNGHADNAKLKAALTAAARHCLELRVLGSYPAPVTRVPRRRGRKGT